MKTVLRIFLITLLCTLSIGCNYRSACLKEAVHRASSKKCTIDKIKVLEALAAKNDVYLIKLSVCGETINYVCWSANTIAHCRKIAKDW